MWTAIHNMDKQLKPHGCETERTATKASRGLPRPLSTTPAAPHLGYLCRHFASRLDLTGPVQATYRLLRTFVHIMNAPGLESPYPSPRARSRVRLAVVGLGRMGKVHASNIISRCSAGELAYVYDPNSDVARAAADELGARTAPSFEALLDDAGTDAIVIASPTGSHAELALQAARAGKHIFCEKPISLDRAATLEVLRTVEQTGVLFQVGFHRRFDPAFAAAAERLRRGELGENYLLRASLRDMAPPRPKFLAGSGGIFVDMGIHDFDAARSLAGEVVAVSAYGSALSSPGFAEVGDCDTAVAVMNFASGALGVLDLSRVAGYGYEASMEVMGSKATVRLDDPFSQRYEWLVPGAATRPLVTTFDQRYKAPLVSVIAGFATCARDGTPPLVGAHDALAAFDIAQAAQESWRLGKRVPVPHDGSTAVGTAAAPRAGVPGDQRSQRTELNRERGALK